MHKNTYCDLKPLDSYFNNKRLYICEYCGLKIGLDNADTKILCFKKMEDLSKTIHGIHTGSLSSDIVHVNDDSSIADTVINKLSQAASIQNDIITNETSDNNLCTNEQIDNRLSICNSCEYFKNNSCLLCGCTVIREANYKNKLAHKDQKCPAGKWDVINN
jgi:hypothetical protein